MFDTLTFSMYASFILMKKDAFENFYNRWSINNSAFKSYAVHKIDNLTKIAPYNINIVSLGSSCVPHTLSIWEGFKLPNFMSGRKRSIFDQSLSNVQGAYDLISGKYSTDTYFDVFYQDKSGQFIIGSSHSGFTFIHDPLPPQLSIREAKSRIISLINQRLECFIKYLKDPSSLLILYLEDREPNEDISYFLRNYDTYEDVQRLLYLLYKTNSSLKYVIINSKKELIPEKENILNIPYNTKLIDIFSDQSSFECGISTIDLIYDHIYIYITKHFRPDTSFKTEEYLHNAIFLSTQSRAFKRIIFRLALLNLDMPTINQYLTDSEFWTQRDPGFNPCNLLDRVEDAALKEEILNKINHRVQ